MRISTPPRHHTTLRSLIKVSMFVGVTWASADAVRGERNDAVSRLDAVACADDNAAAKSAGPETVPVANPGNAADGTGYGAVAYEYRIAKYETTNAEFCEFLNAVAKKDPHELYDDRMSHDGDDDNYGGIIRSGEYGSYTYAVKPGMERKPVNYVMWETALRYANWLTNGKGEGDTETGSYTFDGNDAKLPDHAALAAAKGVKWVLASENEWYKAAYYDPAKSGGGYWLYATGSDEVPQVNINSNAPADVGGDTPSPYGTHDQNGNVWEWNEARSGDKVGLRGGSFHLNDHEAYLRSTTRYDVLSAKWLNYGFRVVALGTPESK